jgi:hypothetical protein
MTLSEIVRDPRKFLKTFQDNIAHIKPVEVDIDIIKTWKHVQTRLHSTVQEHIDHLVELIDSGVKLDSIIVFMDFYGPGKHLIVEGNHRRQACIESKYGKNLDVVYVTQDIWEDYKDPMVINQLGLAYNAHPVKRQLVLNKNDAKNFMFKYFADKQPIEDLPFILATFGYTKREVKSLMNKGEKIKQQQDYLGSLSKNYVFRNWKENGDLQKEVEKKKKPGALVVSMSSGNFSYDKMIFKLSDAIDDNKAYSEMIVILHHPDHPAMTEWVDYWAPKHNKVMKNFARAFNCSFNIIVLDHLKENAEL